MSDLPAARQSRARWWIGRVIRFGVTLAALSWFYGFASPWAYPSDRTLGAWHGALHGGLMPMALPALLLGRDVPIYADHNNGRPYKIGYIAGINVCGLLVFGAALLGPRPVKGTRSGRSQ